jgi:hypothetical protein
MSTLWDHVSELRPLTGHLFIPPENILDWKTTAEWYWQGKAEELGGTLCQCPFVHHKSHMDWPGREPGPPRSHFLNRDWNSDRLRGQPVKTHKHEPSWELNYFESGRNSFPRLTCLNTHNQSVEFPILATSCWKYLVEFYYINSKSKRTAKGNSVYCIFNHRALTQITDLLNLHHQ